MGPENRTNLWVDPLVDQAMEKLDCPRGNIQRRLELIEKKTGKSLKYFVSSRRTWKNCKRVHP
jgi:hypothetical protein